MYVGVGFEVFLVTGDENPRERVCVSEDLCTSVVCHRHVLLCRATTAFLVLEFSLWRPAHFLCLCSQSHHSVWLPQLSFSLLFTTSRASITSRLDSSVLVLGVKEKGVWEALVLAMRLPGYHPFPLPFGHGSTLSLTAQWAPRAQI